MIFQIILYAVLKELVLLFASADFSSSSLPPVDFVCEYACVNLILESFTLWNSMRPYLKLSLWSSFVFASVRVPEFIFLICGSYNIHLAATQTLNLPVVQARDSDFS